MKRTISSRTSGVLFCGPAILFFGLFVLYPFLYAFGLSVMKAQPRLREFVGLANYTKLFNTRTFWLATRNTLGFTFIGVPLQIILSLAIALIAYRSSRGLAAFLRMAYYIPLLTTGVISAAVWRWLFHPSIGALNWIIGRQVIWLGSMPEAFFSCLLVLVATNLGGLILIFMATMAAVDPELLEAAQIDGANRRQENMRIIIPAIWPAVSALTLLRIAGTMQIWMIPYFLTSGGPAYGTTTLVLQVYNVGILGAHYGLGSAYGVVLFLLIFLIAFMQHRAAR